MTLEIMTWIIVALVVFTEALIVTVVMNTKKVWNLEEAVARIKRTLRSPPFNEEELWPVGMNPWTMKIPNIVEPKSHEAFYKTYGSRQESSAQKLWRESMLDIPMPIVQPPPGQYISPIKLEDGKLYYLAHPCTSGGRTMAENKKSEGYLYRRIIDKYPNAKIIRPLVHIPDGLTDAAAMAKCFKLLSACDGALFPVGWQNSGGCGQENGFSKDHGIEIIYLGV
ncbi:DUF4406 domain-containing protein [Acetobacterium sp.]|uniref:DUF4406 domain-containing protein n=1 Tax=Acetobacterium sp. TaxID=1872094 RepID=UPI002F3ECD02